MAAFGPIIGQTDPGAAAMLSDLGDRLGLEVNECGWVIGWVMECYEKGLLTRANTDGLEMAWGNVEATATLLRKIAKREGLGNLLAEGVKRAAEEIGGEALKCAIYTEKGASPRSHDHRPRWDEMMDTCLSNTGTVEVGGAYLQLEQLGHPPIPALRTMHDPWQVPVAIAMGNGRRQFEECLCVCRFCYGDLQGTLRVLNAITGWEFTKEDAMSVGRRIINHLRVFNFRHGLTKDIEVPSARYASVPVDGPAKGVDAMRHWHFMRSLYYQTMGWDPETGKPLPDTLRNLGLEHLIQDLKKT
jgi:aldehyde:ferredoxin oxidoreductase